MAALAENFGNQPLTNIPPRARPSWWLATTISILLLCLFASITPAQSNEPKRVLILMQEDVSWPIFRAIDENARTSLRAGSPGGIVIFGEHMDRVHFSDPRFQTQQQAWIQTKIREFRN